MKIKSESNFRVIKHFENYPMPTPAENKILVKKILAGDVSAKWELVCHNWRFIVYAIKELYHYPLDDDTLSDGFYGFHRATGYLNKKGLNLHRFFGYAARCIITDVQKGFKHRQQQASISLSTQKAHNFKLNFSDIPMDKDFHSKLYPDSSWCYTLKDSLTDRTSLSPLEQLKSKDNKQFFIKLIKTIQTMKMNEQQEKVFLSLIKNDGCIGNIAKEFHISRQRVHFIRNDLIRKIRKFLYNFYPHMQKELLDIVRNKC